MSSSLARFIDDIVRGGSTIIMMRVLMEKEYVQYEVWVSDCFVCLIVFGFYSSLG